MKNSFEPLDIVRPDEQIACPEKEFVYDASKVNAVKETVVRELTDKEEVSIAQIAEEVGMHPVLLELRNLRSGFGVFVPVDGVTREPHLHGNNIAHFQSHSPRGNGAGLERGIQEIGGVFRRNGENWQQGLELWTPMIPTVQVPISASFFKPEELLKSRKLNGDFTLTDAVWGGINLIEGPAFRTRAYVHDEGQQGVEATINYFAKIMAPGIVSLFRLGFSLTNVQSPSGHHDKYDFEYNLEINRERSGKIKKEGSFRVSRSNGNYCVRSSVDDEGNFSDPQGDIGEIGAASTIAGDMFQKCDYTATIEAVFRAAQEKDYTALHDSGFFQRR